MEEKNVAGYGAPEDQLQGAYIGSLYLVPPSVGDAEAITVICNPWVPVGVALAPCIYFLSGSVYSDLRLSHLHLADYMIK